MDGTGWAFPATRAASLERWREFLPRARSYAAFRNRVEPGHPHVSRLSPAIRSRLINTEECIAGLLASFPFASVEKLVQELLWRDYWKGWLELRPDAWANYLAELERVRRTASAEVMGRATEVMAGRGGVGVMDRFARELTETGYLHNHARMWWAGYWCHVERLPWVLGADFFYRHLLDADPASNTLGWRWVAGLQTRGKAYLPRRSNLERYCAPEWLRDPAGMEKLGDDRVQAAPVPWEPELSRVLWVSLPESPRDVPGRWGLWIHGEDLSPELSGLRSLRPAVALTVLDEAIVTKHGLSRLRMQAILRGLEDARGRSSAQYGCPVEHRAAPDGIASMLARVGRERRLDGWVAMRPAVGPLGDAIDEIERVLGDAGLAVQWCRRSWDERWWPLARSGFFPFWEKAERALRRGMNDDPAQGLLLDATAAAVPF